MSFVYLIEEVPLPGESIQPWTKIGFTKNPAEWRLNANLKRGNPRELRFGAVYEFITEAEGWAAEAATHRAFADHRGLTRMVCPAVADHQRMVPCTGVSPSRDRSAHRRKQPSSIRAGQAGTNRR